MVQDYKYYAVRSAAILTGSYVAGTVIGPVGLQNQLMVLIDLTFGALTDAQVKVEFSNDGTTYYQETFSSVSGGTSTESAGTHKFTATGKYRLAIPIKDQYIKISAIGTGDVSNSSMTINAVVGVQ